jgi:copper chaperone CopZ
MSMTYSVEGMTCGGCRAKVEKALAALVPGTTVTLDPPRAMLPQALDGATVNAALARIGSYKAVPMAEPVIEAAASALPEKSLATYRPLILIAAYLTVVSFAGIWGGVHHESAIARWMMNFMAGFFLVFSFFKLLDLDGFAMAYRGDDVVAERLPAWGYVYPFVELGLGLAYLFRLAPTVTNWVTLIVMSVSIIGVIRALNRKQTIRCACLGTVLNLPMSTVTLIEDGLMIAMAAAMLAL